MWLVFTASNTALHLTHTTKTLIHHRVFTVPPIHSSHSCSHMTSYSLPVVERHSVLLLLQPSEIVSV